MRFEINHDLLKQAAISLSKKRKLYWLVGGAGSGKTTVCQILSKLLGMSLYDMDAKIYGTYHRRFTKERHPVNYEWANAENGLEWLLNMSWDEFNSFNQAALAEYLDLLAEDVRSEDPENSLLIDGGICNPGLLARAIPANQIVCLAREEQSSELIWDENKERRGMKTIIQQLPNPTEAWQTFLEFDTKITQNSLQECADSSIEVCTRSKSESPDVFSKKVAQALGIELG